MFNQYIGDGANVFITIVAIIIGFVTALGYLDAKKVSEEEEKHQ